jgi:hypothetical protein
VVELSRGERITVTPDGGRRSERLLQAALAALVLALTALHVVAVYRENVNWDEFALFSRARETFEGGHLVGGGRPGLVVLVLLPFVHECTDAVSTVRAARILWSVFTVAFLVALYVFVAGLRRGLAQPWRGAALAVGLLALVPVFARWSLQVRTDQPALAAALWGGVALLASRRKPALAALAGLAFALGYLCSEKALYVVALCGLAAVADLILEPELRWRRESRRVGWMLAGGGLALGAFRGAVALLFDSAPAPTVGAAMQVFAFYRRVLGFRVYRGMLPTLTPHLLLAALFVVALVVTWNRRLPGGARLAAAGTFLALGVAVGLFHAGAFPYFWMTLGIFPAAAFGVALEPTLAWLPSSRLRLGAIAIVGALLLAHGLPAAVAVLADTQRPQIESLAFIARNFPPEAVGFHPEKALFCRAAAYPFQTFFSQHIVSRFSGAQRQENVEALLADFRRLPVQFIVDSYRLAQFPPEIRRFWAENYLLYRARVSIPARRVAGDKGESLPLDILVAGPYLWVQRAAPDSGHLVVDGAPISRGGVIELAAGDHRAELVGGPVEGILWLAVDEPPAPSRDPFYSLAARAEFEGIHLP